MNVLDIFSGIGGFSLGLERAGHRTVAFCEIEPYCRQILAKHWPDVPIYPDVTQLTSAQLAADGVAADIIAGGFPCQDISVAGNGEGIRGERSGLWGDFARLIGELRPRYAIVENVPALLSRGLGEVLGDLASLRYDAEWHCIPASAVGAPHRRDRIWIIAYPDSGRQQVERFAQHSEQQSAPRHEPDGLCEGRRRDRKKNLADTESEELRRGLHAGAEGDDRRRRGSDHGSDERDVGEPRRTRLEIGPRTLRQWSHATTTGTGWWHAEPELGRVAHGVPNRVDRIKGLGNAIVPHMAELIGRAING